MTELGRIIRLSRPRFWLYLAGPALVGASFAADSASDLFSPYIVGLLLYFLVPGNILLYGVNDIFDADIDAINPKKDRQEVRYGGDRLTPLVTTLCAIIGIVLVALSPSASMLWLLGFFFLAVEYSAPPLRFKTKPILDSVSNGLYILPGVAAYAALAGEAPPVAAVAGAWLWTMAMHTFSAIPDIEPDREAGISTTATLLGERVTLAYCLVCWLACSLSFFVAVPVLGVLLATYPVLILVIIGSGIQVSRAYWWFPVINAAVGMLMTFVGLIAMIR